LVSGEPEMLRFLVLVVALVALAVPALAQDSIISLPPPDISAPPDDTASGPAADEEPAGPLPCGGETITIAKMQWPSAQLLAEIHARLIKLNFGCDVQVVPGDMAASASSMGLNGQPAVAPELWITRVADVWNGALKGQEVRQAGTTYAEPQFEGWFIPDYVAAAHPEIKSVADLKANWREFATGGRKGRFISCPPDWGCAVINRNLMRANGLSDLFEIVEPANRFELDTLIQEAESRKEPILFYYWQPNAVLAQFAFKSIALGAYNKDAFACLGRVACPDPKASGFAADPVIVALAQWVYLDAPEVAAYFQRAHMPFAEMNALLQELNEPGATIESVADGFVAARGEVWQQWVGKPASQ
jgi:glycine betaine/proline transport system substrate-binding protein